MKRLRTMSFCLALGFLALAVLGGCASDVTLKGKNPPVADAGNDQEAYLGDPVLLGGGLRARADGVEETLHYRWELLSRPEGATASLQNEQTPEATLVPDAVGSWIVSLVIQDSAGTSLPDVVRIQARLRPCDTAGECGEGVRCCQHLCQPGISCCADAECDDDNACTTDTCEAGRCAHSCHDPSCMKLRAQGSVFADVPATVRIDSCAQSFSPGRLACDSDRNATGSWILQQGFESGLSPLNTTTSSQLHLVGPAQAPGAAGVQGISLCGQGAGMWYELNATGRKDLAVWISATNPAAGAGLPDGSALRMDFARSVNDTAYTSLALFGDGLVQPWQRLGLLLPATVEGYPQVGLGFYVTGPSTASQCVLFDELTIQDLPDATRSRVLWKEDLGALPCALTSATALEPGGAGSQLTLVSSAGNCYARLAGNAGEALVSAPIDTTSLTPQSDLVLSWRWARELPLAVGAYFLIEYSTDGTTWRQLAGTGNGLNKSGSVDGAPADWLTQRALLPEDARGIETLRLRVVGPATSGATDQAVRIDDLELAEVTRAWTDRFGPASDLGQGRLAIPVTSSQTGAVTFQCRKLCPTPPCPAAALSLTVGAAASKTH